MAYSEAQRQAVIATAIAAQAARVAGHDTATLGEGNAAQVFNLVKGGMCCRFVRQTHETALGIVPFSWPYDAETAHDMIAHLAAAGHEIPFDRATLQAGTILGFAGNPGHILVYVHNIPDPAKDLCAENTSSASRGWPTAAGTKLTALDDVLAVHGGVARAFWLY